MGWHLRLAYTASESAYIIRRTLCIVNSLQLPVAATYGEKAILQCFLGSKASRLHRGYIDDI